MYLFLSAFVYSQFEDCWGFRALMKNDTLNIVLVKADGFKYETFFEGKLLYEWSSNCEIHSSIFNDDLELLSAEYKLIDLKTKKIKQISKEENDCSVYSINSFFKIKNQRYVFKTESCSFTKFTWAIDNTFRMYSKNYVAEIDSNYVLTDYKLLDNNERISTHWVKRVPNEEKSMFYKYYDGKHDNSNNDLHINGVNVFIFNGNEIEEDYNIMEAEEKQADIFNNYLIKLNGGYYFFYYDNYLERNGKLFFKKSEDIKTWSNSTPVENGETIRSYSYNKENIFFIESVKEGYKLIKFNGNTFKDFKILDKTFGLDVKNLGLDIYSSGHLRIEDNFYVDSEENLYIVYHGIYPDNRLKIIYIPK